MRVPQSPLSEEETEELAALLERSGGQSLAFARGVFAAVATAPTEVDTPQWLALLIGQDTPNPESLRRLMDLVLREYSSCADCLELGVPAVPEPGDKSQVKNFCRGYMQVAHRDEAWKADMQAFALTIPLAMLAGYLDPQALQQSLRPESETPEAYRQHHQQQLADDVARLHDYWASARAERDQAQPAKSEKIGRNELCPCGSGKKFKKCCGRTSH